MKIAFNLALGLLLIHPVLGEDLYLETQVKLRIAKKDEKRSREGGLEHVPFRIWLPDGVKTIRGVTFNPFYTKAVTQEHWQAACRHWGFGLPSESQWEYAARAGTTTTYFFGVEHSQISKYANFADKAWFDTGETYANHAHRNLSDGYSKLAPVGSLQPNNWGLHDMLGNVAEWTDDAVMRGGSWVSTPRNCRCAHRQKMGDRDQRNYLGIRVVIRKSSTATTKKQ